MRNRYCIYAGSKYRVLREERLCGVQYLVIEDEPGHEDRVQRDSCEYTPNSKPEKESDNGNK